MIGLSKRRVNRFSHLTTRRKARKTREDARNADKTKTRDEGSPVFYYSGRISDVHDDGDGDGGDSDADEDDGRSYSISAVHFMLRIVTHAREPRGGTDIPRTLYDLRNINIFLLPMTCSYDPTSFFVPFSLCISYAP